MSKNNQKTKCFEYYVDGMHCAACEVLIENKLSKIKGIKKVRADLKTGKVLIESDSEPNVQALTNEVINDGYKVVSDKPKEAFPWMDFVYAIPIGLFVMCVFVILQKLGIINFNTSGNLSYTTILLIGVVASFSSCMAVVGGLVLSLSASYAKESRSGKNISQFSFHVSRLVAFFILGGILGSVAGILSIYVITSLLLTALIGGIVFTLVRRDRVGKIFVTTASVIIIALIMVLLKIVLHVDDAGAKVILSVVLGIVLIVLALNMMDIFPILRKLQPHIPKFVGNKIVDIEPTGKFSNIFTPVLLGAATFFLPCGFTQSMQLYAVSTGNFLSGAMTMFIFAIGTLPVLALISFTSSKLASTNKAGIFFKAAGIIVLFFAILNLLGALALAGIIPPVLNI